MTAFSRIDVARKMATSGLVPLFYHEDKEVCLEVLNACYQGGARLMEFTSRGDYALDIFRELNQYARKELPDLILGVGSVTDAGLASQYMHYGAGFVVTPVLREDIAIACNRRKVLWSPGCATLTEIAKAEELGCEVVKIFPGDNLGPGFVRAVKGPCPWTSIMVTGGVSSEPDNLKAWFGAGVTCVGMGSKLITKEILTHRDYDQLKSEVARILAIIDDVRKK